jgi:iron complex outermembrane receptor protein
MTLSGQMTHPVSSAATWTLRGASSLFRRGGNYAGLDFAARQINMYLETNVWWAKPHDDLVLGINVTGEIFELLHSTPSVPFDDFQHHTGGLFAQFDHRFSQKVALQAGFRADHDSRYNWFALPRVSLLYRPSVAFSGRIGYGRGYKRPNLFEAAGPMQPIA